MCAEYTIKNYFQHFNIDDDKPCIDEEVKHCHQRIAKHFLLTKSEQQHVSPALCFVVAIIFITAKIDIAADLLYFFGK